MTLTEIQTKALQYLCDNGTSRLSQIGEHLFGGVQNRFEQRRRRVRTENLLMTLKRAGLVHCRGMGFWEITADGNQTVLRTLQELGKVEPLRVDP